MKCTWKYILLGMICTQVVSAELTAEQILEKSYLSTRWSDSTASVRMILRNNEGVERTRQLTLFSKLQGNGPDAMYTLFFQSPADIRGTATLLIQRAGAEDDMWVYLPAMRKTRRLFSDNKRDSFFGSDLSYGDIIGHRPADWKTTMLREDTFEGRPVYVVEALPAMPDVKASSGYSKRTLMIDKSSFIALKTEYIDEQGQALKTVVVSELKSPDSSGKLQFMHLEADQLQTGNHTILEYETFQHDTGLQDAQFTQRQLERGVDVP